MVCPAEINTEAGETVPTVASLVCRVTVTPLAGAATERVTGNATDCPAGTVTLEGSPMAPSGGVAITVTEAVVSAKPVPLA